MVSSLASEAGTSSCKNLAPQHRVFALGFFLPKGPLIIRNLTRQSLTLKQVEHFEASKPSTSDQIDRLTSNFTTLLRDNDDVKKQKRHLYSKLDENGKPVKKNDLTATIEPFSLHKTSIQTGPTEGKAIKVLRLTFASNNSGHYRIDIPAPTYESQTLKPLSPGAGTRQYTAIFNPETCVLALFDTSNLSKWMKEMPDHLSLSTLSIPGTHNSPTCHNALPSVRCQAVSPHTQLENGVRFFDVRLQIDDPEKANSDALQLVHSAFPISLTGSKHFRGLLDDIYSFLEKNPSETLILCLKREGRGNGTDAQLADRLKEHYINPKHWHTAPGIPKLGDVRGKIVVMRRFNLSEKLKKDLNGKGWGIDATNWGDNTENHHGGAIQIQDFYEMTESENIDKKIRLVCEHFERAGTITNNSTTHPKSHLNKPHGSERPLHISFLSASNFFKPTCWPEKIAAKLNPAITAFLCEEHDVKDEAKGDGCTGVVVCDWVGEDGEWDLVRAVVGMNSRILMTEEEHEAEEEEGESGDAEDDEVIGAGGRERGGRRRGLGRGRGRGRGRERGGARGEA